MNPGGCLSATATIVNKRGMHARAAAKLVEAASRFNAHITVGKGEQCVDARSLMGVMLLDAPLGSEVEISAAGNDAKEAITAILALIDAKFGEE